MSWMCFSHPIRIASNWTTMSCYDISHHTIYYIPLNFKIKIAKEVSKRYFKMNIAKLYWSNFLKIHFLLQNIMNDILPYYKFSDILLHLYNSFSVYCFSWLVNMGCGTKLSPNIVFSGCRNAFLSQGIYSQRRYVKRSH